MPCIVCGTPIIPVERAELGFTYCKTVECGRWARQPSELTAVGTGKTGVTIMRHTDAVDEGKAGRLQDARRATFF